MKPASEGKSDLSRRTVYGYGLGEFGYSFYLNLISSYLMFYMTDVLLLPTKLTGILYSAVQWVEAATALAAGILIDNLFTSKGRYRPWIFRGSVICALSTALLFTRLPLGAAGTATVFVVLYTISYAGYNLMFVAYRAIMGAIGKTPSDTVALTISGTQLSTLASLAFGQIGVRLLHGFSRIETGYTVSAGLYGLILVIALAAVCAVTKPYDPGRAEAKKAEKAPGVSPKQMLRALPPILPCAFGFIFSIGASTLLFSMLAYYFNWVIGDSAGMSTLITVMTVARLAATFVVTPLSRRFEKRTIFISSMLLSAVCITLAHVFRENRVLFYIAMGLYFFCLVPAGAMLMPCISDSVDYNLYRKGIQARGFLYAVASTLSYVAQFVGAMAASAGMVLIRYESALPVQSAETLSGIPKITFLGTAVLSALSILPMLFHRLNRDVMGSIYREKSL